MSIPTPTIPTFTDGMIVHATDLNALAANLTNLYTYNQATFNSQRPCVIAKQTTGQSIPNNTNTLLNFQSAAINTDNMWTASVPNQVTIQHAGIYLLSAQVMYPQLGGATIGTNGGASICVNGTSPITNAVAVGANNAGQNSPQPTGQMTTLQNLAAGATVFLNAAHTFGSAQTLLTTYGSSYLAAIFITPST